MSQLKTNLLSIKQEKDTKILAENIKSGVSIFGVSGNVIALNGETKTVTPTTSQQTIVPTGTGKNALTQVTVNAVTSAIDQNIVASNIKNGVTILGVTGTYNPYQIREYASETAMNNDIANISEGEVVKVNPSVNASTNFTYNDVSYSVPDFPEDGNTYYLIVKSGSSYYLFTSSTRIRYCDSSTYSGYGEVYGSNAILYRQRGSTWELDDNYGSDFWRSSFNNSSNFIYCNYDILMKTSNDVVFQAPTLIITFYLKETTMKKLVKEEDTLSPADAQQAEEQVADLLGEGAE